MLPDSVDEAALQDRARDGALEGAEELVEGRAVLSIVTRESTTEARVLGRKSYPHHHVVHLEPDDPDAHEVEAMCTCTSDDSPWCKHVLAVLLTADRQPALPEERDTIPAELEGLPRDELEALTQRLLEEKAGLEDVVDVHVELAGARQAAGDGHQTVDVDPGVFRRRVDTILHGGYFGTFHSHTRAQATAEAMLDLIEAARELLKLEQPSASLDVLEAITDAYLDGWDVIMGLGRWPNVPVDELADAIEEALQTADLSETEARRWRSRLEDWQAEVEPYGHDEGFKPAMGVLDEG